MAWFQARAEEEEPQVQADISDAYRQEKAFKRRGMFMDTTGILSYQSHEIWRRRLFNAMAVDPPHASDSPPGIADILAADKQIWILLSERCATGIRPTNEGIPMEKCLRAVLDTLEVQSFLMCRPRNHGKGQDPKPPAKAADNPAEATAPSQGQKKRQRQQEAKSKEQGTNNVRLNEEANRLKQQLREANDTGPGGRPSGGKAKGKDKAEQGKDKNKSGKAKGGKGGKSDHATGKSSKT